MGSAGAPKIPKLAWPVVRVTATHNEFRRASSPLSGVVGPIHRIGPVKYIPGRSSKLCNPSGGGQCGPPPRVLHPTRRNAGPKRQRMTSRSGRAARLAKEDRTMSFPKLTRWPFSQPSNVLHSGDPGLVTKQPLRWKSTTKALAEKPPGPELSLCALLVSKGSGHRRQNRQRWRGSASNTTNCQDGRGRPDPVPPGAGLQGRTSFSRGKRMETVVPFPGWLSMETEARWSFRIW